MALEVSASRPSTGASSGSTCARRVASRGGWSDELRIVRDLHGDAGARARPTPGELPLFAERARSCEHLGGGPPPGQLGARRRADRPPRWPSSARSRSCAACCLTACACARSRRTPTTRGTFAERTASSGTPASTPVRGERRRAARRAPARRPRAPAPRPTTPVVSDGRARPAVQRPPRRRPGEPCSSSSTAPASAITIAATWLAHELRRPRVVRYHHLRRCATTARIGDNLGYHVRFVPSSRTRRPTRPPPWCPAETRRPPPTSRTSAVARLDALRAAG